MLQIMKMRNNHYFSVFIRDLAILIIIEKGYIKIIYSFLVNGKFNLSQTFKI